MTAVRSQSVIAVEYQVIVHDDIFGALGNRNAGGLIDGCAAHINLVVGGDNMRGLNLDTRPGLLLFPAIGKVDNVCR